VVVKSHSDVHYCNDKLTNLSLYVDFVFAIALIQRNSHGRIRLADTDPEETPAQA
jgi:hypothetical protein